MQLAVYLSCLCWQLWLWPRHIACVCVLFTYAVYVLFCCTQRVLAESGPGSRLALVSCSCCPPFAVHYYQRLSALLLLVLFAASQRGQCVMAFVQCCVLEQSIGVLQLSTSAGGLMHTCHQQSCRHLLGLQLAAAAAVQNTLLVAPAPG